MIDTKYVAFDVHQATLVVAVLDPGGKLVTQAVLKTEATAVRDFLRGLSGVLHLTFEEGTHTQWLFDLTRPLVAGLIVCNPRKLHSQGNQNDRLDALKLAQALRGGQLKPVYPGSPQTQTLKQLAHNYEAITADCTDYEICDAKLARRRKKPQTRGLTKEYNHRLKRVFKSAALEALKEESIKNIYTRLTGKGVRSEMAMLTVARKLAAVTLAVWKSGEEFDEQKLTKRVA